MTCTLTEDELGRQPRGIQRGAANPNPDSTEYGTQGNTANVGLWKPSRYLFLQTMLHFPGFETSIQDNYQVNGGLKRLGGLVPLQGLRRVPPLMSLCRRHELGPL